MLTPEDMAHLSRLSRLAPDDVTLERFGAQCGDILKYMDVLAEVDTTDVEPLYSPAQHVQKPRTDEPLRRRNRAEVLANAPETDGQFFIVPRIV